MNEPTPPQGDAPPNAPLENDITPLPGEPGIPDLAQRQRSPVSRKALLAIGLPVLLVVSVIGVAAHRFASNLKGHGDTATARQGSQATAAAGAPRRLELVTPLPAAQAAPTPAAPAGPLIPALQPMPEDAEPIGVRRTGSAAPPKGGRPTITPMDAPVLLVSTRPGAFSHTMAGAPNAVAASPISTHPEAGTSPGAPDGLDSPEEPMAATTRNLQAYQQRLQGLLDNLTKSTALVTGQSPPNPPTGAWLSMPPDRAPPSGPPLAQAPPAVGTQAGGRTAATSSLFGGQLQRSATPTATAGMLGNRSLTLPKGTAFTCALKTRVISATSGMVGCQVLRNVYSDNGRVLLVERGSHLDGEYRIASVRAGMVRIPVLWTRIRTPLGVTVDIDSPATGPLGEAGIAGHVDNRWGERIGAAMLLSLIDDSVKLVIQNQANDHQGGTLVLPNTTANTSKLAETVLDSTINIPPLIYQNQGGVVGIYVARDVDFSQVYALQPVPR